MEKITIDNFISKYSLGGEIESVIWNSVENGVGVKFISDDKTLVGEVKTHVVNLPNGNYPIYTTSQVKNLLGVLDSSINVTSDNESIIFSDESTSVTYMLAEESVIPNVPELKQLPEFDVEIMLTDEIVNKFVKSKAALSDSETFTFICEGGKSRIVLGFSSNIRTNNISIAVDAKTNGDVKPISFSSKFFTEMLKANKGAKASSLKISSAGLSLSEFEFDGYKSTYYLVSVNG